MMIALAESIVDSQHGKFKVRFAIKVPIYIAAYPGPPTKNKFRGEQQTDSWNFVANRKLETFGNTLLGHVLASFV